ncbi:hypothetical protein LMIY3S_03374 [Labrys miyagiensis]
MLIPDTVRSLGVCADLVNYADAPQGEAVTLEWAKSMIRRYKMSYAGPLDAPIRHALRQLGAQFRPLFEMKEAQLAQWANGTVRDLRIYPQIVTHDGLGWHIHYFEPDTPLVDRIRGSTAMAAMDIVQRGEARRLRICAAEDCNNVFLDTTRNLSKIFCDPAGCGNRVHGLRFRQRNRANGQDSPVQ